MPANSENWLVRYPRRTPHPPRPRVRLDAVERAATTGSNLLFALGAPLPLREKSSSLLRLPQRAESAETGGGGLRRPNNVPSDCREVRFDSVVKMILVPTRTDLGELAKDLWWQEEEYLQFR